VASEFPILFQGTADAARSGEFSVAKGVTFKDRGDSLKADPREAAELHSELQKSISATEARAKAYHSKSIDPNISAETQAKYRNLENRLSRTKEGLYQSMKALDAQKADIQRLLRDFQENQEIIAELGAFDDARSSDSTIESLEAGLRKAADLFPRESESQQAKLKYFDEMAQALSAYLKEVSPNGGLYSELQKSITATEARMRAYHDNSIDSNISAETQQKYRKLEERLLGCTDGLYRSKRFLDAKRADLQRRLHDVNENRALVADMSAVEEVVKSCDAISHVSKNFVLVLQSIDSKLDEIIQRSD
jgi:hypothetical protein